MKSNESNLSPELVNKLKALGVSESDTKEQIAKILSENNVGLLQELLSDPSLSSGLKRQIEGALSDYGPVSQPTQSENKEGDLDHKSQEIPDQSTKLESFDILARAGTRIIGEVHKSNSGEVTKNGVSSIYDKSSNIDENTIVGIGSAGKEHTAATLLKLWDNELSRSKQDEKNVEDPWFADKEGNIGLKVKLSRFMPLLKERYPDCSDFFNQIEQYDYFNKITLEDLLNHEHGLGARDNDQMFDLMVQKAKANDDSPLNLSDIVKSSKKRGDGDKYGEHSYGNLGYDIVAMIAEGITNQPFDKVVRDAILTPYELNDTYTQSDHRALYQREDLDVAQGFYQHGDKGEANFNKFTNTRGAGGMKSTIADLDKFAKLFMTGNMFDNEQVKAQLKDRGSKDYHLAIQDNKDGSFGHRGNDMVFESNLKFNPETNETEVELQVLENLTHHVSAQTFAGVYGPQRAKGLDCSNGCQAITDSGFWPVFHGGGRPAPRGEEFNKMVADHLQKSPELDRIISDYSNIRESVMEYDADYLKANMEDVVESLSKKHRKEIHASSKDGSNDPTLQTLKHKVTDNRNRVIDGIEERKEGPQEVSQEFMYQTKDLLNPDILDDIVNSSKPLDEIEMPFSPKNFIRTAPTGFAEFILNNNSEEVCSAVLNSKPGDDSLFLSTSVVSSGSTDRKSSDFVSAKDKDLAQLQSVTKHFTAVLAMRMVEDGIIDLDEPICSYFDRNQDGLLGPIQKLNNPPESKEEESSTRFFNMSMRDILSHKSGVRYNQDGIFEKTGDTEPNYDSGPFILADLALESAAKKYSQEHSGELSEELTIASKENLTVSALMDSFVLRPPEGSRTKDGKLRPRFDQIFCPKGKKGEDHGILLDRVMPSFNDANKEGQIRQSTDGFINNEGHGGYNHNRGYAMIGSTHDVARFMNELWKEGSVLSPESRKEMLSRSHDTGHGLGTFVTRVDDKYVIGHFGNGLDCLSQASFVATQTQGGLPIDGVALATASTFITNKGLPDLSAMREYSTTFDKVSHEDKARLEETWPIMSTSKGFCGALIVSSAHEYFGEKGVKSTVREALEFAKTQNPDRAENINTLIASLEQSGSADLQIAKILNHTAGLNNNNKAYSQTPKYEAKDPNSYFGEMEVSKEDEWNYSNNGYYLLERLVNLTSQSGDYRHEMTEKIFKPLDLSQTKFLEQATFEERQRVGDGGFVMPYPNSFTTGTYEETYPIRDLSAGAGGLMSSGQDTQKFFTEYTKMMLGEDNTITGSPDPEIATLYQEMLVPTREGSDEYFSLGVMVSKTDKHLLVGHDGGHASNSCHARVKVNGSIEDFRSGSLTQDKISGFEFDVNKSSATAGMLKYAVLFHVMEGYFQDKISTLSEEEQKAIQEKLTPEKIGVLIKTGLLPDNFKDFERELYDVTKNSYLDHIKKEFLNDSGKVDEERLIKHYESDKQAFYEEVLSDPEAQKKIGDILKRCDLQASKHEEKIKHILTASDDTQKSKQQQLDESYSNFPPRIFGVAAQVTSFSDDEESKENKDDVRFISVGPSIATEEARADSDSHNIDSETIFGIASVTKMFTSATLLKIMESEEHSKRFSNGLDTPLSEFTEGLKEKYQNSDFIQSLDKQNNYEEITLRHLLTHTSGLDNYARSTDFFSDVEEKPEKMWTIEDILQKGNMVKNGASINEYSYNNTGYTLLGAIIEQVNGKTFGESVKEFVTDPLKLNHTYTHEQLEAATKENPNIKIAQPSIVDASGNAKDSPFISYAFAAGNMYSTPDDMNRFTRAFLTNDPNKSMFEKDETRREMRAAKVLGREGDEGEFYSHLGFREATQNTIHKTGSLYHPGGGVGISSLALYDPKEDQSLSVVEIKQWPTAQLRNLINSEAEKRGVATKSMSEEAWAKELSLVRGLDEGERKSDLEEKQQEKSFVEKLGLSEREKTRSFVEAATAGKFGNIGSKGGAHEL